ncbi:MAG TPA: FHA domain-containing protein [Candidatus Eremiobacteraeota bacterium]|nr:FHA domain-containing protein [Candidatus Eremiobacteraeota bacterium]
MEKRSYPVKNFPVTHLSTALDTWYQSLGFETQILRTQVGGLIIQARKEGFLRTVVGMSTAITVTINQKETYLLIEVGGANWADKAGAAAIGYIVFWPTLLSAGFGVYEQTKIIKQTWDVIDRYITTYTSGTTSNEGPLYQIPVQSPSYQSSPSPPQSQTACPQQQYIPPPTAMIPEPVSQEVPGTRVLNEGESWGRLVVDSGPHEGETFELNLPLVSIGRNPDCNIILTKDDCISRNHAYIYLKDGEVVISDQGSKHGTFINEKPVSTAFITDTSILQVGKTILRFYLTKK